MLALIWKDLQIELRTRESSASLLLLGVLSLLILSFAFDPTSELRREAAPGSIWVAVAFAATQALGRCFLTERENHCLAGLLVSPIDRGSIYLAKAVVNVVVMSVSLTVLLPACVLFFDLPVGSGLIWVAVSLALGVIGLAASGTLFAAIAVQTRAREVILPLLMLPIVVPVFLAGLRLSSKALAAGSIDGVEHWLHLMIGTDVVFLVVGWLAFEYVVTE